MGPQQAAQAAPALVSALSCCSHLEGRAAGWGMDINAACDGWLPQRHQVRGFHNELRLSPANPPPGAAGYGAASYEDMLQSARRTPADLHAFVELHIEQAGCRLLFGFCCTHLDCVCESPHCLQKPGALLRSPARGWRVIRHPWWVVQCAHQHFSVMHVSAVAPL